MARARTWPQDFLRTFIARAEQDGKAQASVDSPIAASRLRYALYNLRRREGIGRGLSFTLSGTSVIAAHRADPPTPTLEPQVEPALCP